VLSTYLRWGVQLSKTKLTQPTSTIEWLGIIFNLEDDYLELSIDKRKKYATKFTDALTRNRHTEASLAKLLGYAYNASRVISAGRANLYSSRRLYAMASKRKYVFLNPLVRQEWMWWITVLDLHVETSAPSLPYRIPAFTNPLVIQHITHARMASDASSRGAGGIKLVDNNMTAWRVLFPDWIHAKHRSKIHMFELLAIALNLSQFDLPMHILILTDSHSCKDTLTTRSASHKPSSHILKLFYKLLGCTTSECAHLAGQKNTICDDLSRINVDHFPFTANAAGIQYQKIPLNTRSKKIIHTFYTLLESDHPNWSTLWREPK